MLFLDDFGSFEWVDQIVTQIIHFIHILVQACQVDDNG